MMMKTLLLPLSKLENMFQRSFTLDEKRKNVMGSNACIPFISSDYWDLSKQFCICACLSVFPCFPLKTVIQVLVQYVLLL